MKIAMIGQKGIPSRAGGVEIHVEEIAAELVKMGNEVDVYCRRSYCKDRKKLHRGIHLIYVPSIATKYLDAIIYTFFATIAALFKKYDIFHYHACGPASLCWIPRMFGKKVVCTTHGQDWRRAKWGAIGQDYLKLGERILAKYSNQVIVLNEPMQQYYKEVYNRDTHIIPNGIRVPKIQEADLISKKFGIEKESYILYLGRLVPEKGIHYLIEAYNSIKTDKKLIIAGGSSHSDDYVEQLGAMSAENDNIIMTGFVEGKLLEELYSNTLLYVLPSDVEGLPISLLEAMSYGRCCLVSDIPENMTTCNEIGFHFTKASAEDLANELNEILALPIEAIHKIGTEAEQYVLGKFKWQEVARETDAVYKETLGLREKAAAFAEGKSCKILGVNIAVTNMETTVQYIEKNIEKLKGCYICVANGHTTVMASENEKYRTIQNNAAMALPDGEPLSIVSRMRGFKEAERVTGPDLMTEMFVRANKGNGLKHYFYGGREDTLVCLKEKLSYQYSNMQIAGLYSPPFRELTEEEDQAVIQMLNASGADIVWVGLGAPKQEIWMYEHRDKVNALMIGVGAGFDYHAGKIKRAPVWMQHMSLEWLCRLMQDPGRLWKRYLVTNVKFMIKVAKEGRKKNDNYNDLP